MLLTTTLQSSPAPTATRPQASNGTAPEKTEGAGTNAYDTSTVELEFKKEQPDTHYANGLPRADLSDAAQVRCGNVKAQPFSKFVAGAMLATGAWTAFNIATQVISSGNPVAIAAGVGVTAASLLAGYASADLASGVFHHFIDNYPDEHTPVIGKMAKEFQEHHHRTYDLLEVNFLDNCNASGRFMWPGLGALAWANPHYAVQAFGLAFTAGSYLAQGSHRWTHMKDSDLPTTGKVMQKLGLAQSKLSHATHHRMPWDDYYCIVNGMWNPILNKTDFWRKLERVYHVAFGAEPKSWRAPLTKQLALGQITKQEFIEKQKFNRQQFAELIRDEREYWRSVDRERKAQLEAKGANPADRPVSDMADPLFFERDNSAYTGQK